MSAWQRRRGDRQESTPAPPASGAAGPASYRRGVCRFFRERGYCGRGERCRFHHIRSQCVRARYDMGHEAASDISIDLEGTPALVFCADGTVRLRCGIPREWEYFRALNVVMRAVDLRLKYDGDLDGDWQVARRSDRTGSAAALLSPHEDTILPAFDGGAFEHVQALVRRLPCDIEVAKVSHAQSTGGG